MAGCPVITTKASGTMVACGRGGMIVPERDVDALVEAIQSVVKDRDKRDELAASCEDLAKEFTEDSWSERLMEALTNPTPEIIPADLNRLKV